MSTRPDLMQYFASMRVSKQLLPVLAILGLAACAASPTESDSSATVPAVKDIRLDRFEWNGSLPASRAVSVRNPYGNIEARRSNEGDVQLVGNAQQLITDTRAFAFDVKPGDSISVVVGHPDAASTDRGLDANGRFAGRVDVVVLVPDGAQLSLHAIHGEVKVKRLNADVVTSTIDGDMSFDTAGVIQATTLQGSILATLRGENYQKPLMFKSKTGDVTLNVPASAGLNLELSGGRSLRVGRSGDKMRDVPSHALRMSLGHGGQDLRALSEQGTVTAEIM